MKWFLEEFLPSFPDGKYYFYYGRIPKWQYAGFRKNAKENNWTVLTEKQADIFFRYMQSEIKVPHHTFFKFTKDGIKIEIDRSDDTYFCTLTIVRENPAD